MMGLVEVLHMQQAKPPREDALRDALRQLGGVYPGVRDDMDFMLG